MSFPRLKFIYEQLDENYDDTMEFLMREFKKFYHSGRAIRPQKK